MNDNRRWSNNEEEFFIRHIGEFSEMCIGISKVKLLENYLAGLDKRRKDSGIDLNRMRTVANIELMNQKRRLSDV